MKIKKATKMFSALAQETRVQIYRLLLQEGPEGIAAGMIAEILQIPAATLSFHLNQLSEAGLLKSEKKGRSVIYSARYKSIKRLMDFMVEDSYKKREKKLKKITNDE